MKGILKSIVAGLLATLARSILRKYNPKIVMVTGSVGKTSTKDAIAAALSVRFNLRAIEKSYNSEFGLPLTVIGAKNPWENPAAWFKVFQEALALIMLPNLYPKLLVLEVGADRPGDLAKILKIATPDTVVVTKLPDVPVHVEAYASPQAVRDEEFAPAYALPVGAPLIISADDPHAVRMADRLRAKVVTFGFSETADIRLTDLDFVSGGEGGMRASVNGSTIEVLGALGRPQLYAPAAAFATARALGLTEEEAFEGLALYAPPPGRGRILPGKNGSRLIDDTYNSSPAAVEEALNALSLVPAERRIAVLGDMLELGRYSVEEHTRIGKLASEKVDMLVVVGHRSRATREAALRSGMPEEQALFFDTSKEAAEALPKLVTEGDVVLVKGSQSIRMERVSEALLADPFDAKKLVRQEVEWRRR